MNNDQPEGGARPRYPGYDVLSKWDTPSWNEPTRSAVGRRLQVRDVPGFLEPERFRILQAVCDRIVPQPSDRVDRIPVAGLVDRMLEHTEAVGYRQADMPPLREAWQRGLDALDDEAKIRFGAAFPDLPAARQDSLLKHLQDNDVRSPAWQDLPAKAFFMHRLLHDVTVSYYSHPIAWNEIGFGGPASPRGYVRLETNRRDPWEAQARDAD